LKIEVSKVRREVEKVARFSEIFGEQRLEKSKTEANINSTKKTKRL
jgi:hypothetical protein